MGGGPTKTLLPYTAIHFQKISIVFDTQVLHPTHLEDLLIRTRHTLNFLIPDEVLAHHVLMGLLLLTSHGTKGGKNGFIKGVQCTPKALLTGFRMREVSFLSVQALCYQ